jgi:formate C-acetyltransferase
MNAPINKDLIAANSDRCAQPPSERVEALKKAVQSETNGACIERALLWTEYDKDKRNRGKTPAVRIAEATRHVLNHKSVKIYPRELIVGNFTSKRVAGFCYP